MFAFSTLNITRARAIELILERIASGAISDVELEAYLDGCLHQHLHNAKVVPGPQSNDDRVLDELERSTG